MKPLMMPLSLAAFGGSDFDDVFRDELFERYVARVYDDTDVDRETELDVDHDAGHIYVEVALLWMTYEINRDDRPDLEDDWQQRTPGYLSVTIDRQTGRAEVEAVPNHY